MVDMMKNKKAYVVRKKVMSPRQMASGKPYATAKMQSTVLSMKMREKSAIGRKCETRSSGLG
jgi:hypothetical protein